MTLHLCLDPMWNQKAVDRSVSGYDEDVEPTMSDSDDDEDDDDNIIRRSTVSPRNVRRAESLKGPYSLLSLPLPSDAPDSGRRGSDRESPERSSYSATSVRSPRSLDQRLDELLAKGELGDGISPPSSVSDQQSDVEDSLSEEELDIIKLRKPVTVTLQPGASKVSHSTPSQPKPSDPKSSDRKSCGPRGSDHVAPVVQDNAPLTDDMVDQIVRMKPMLARATRQPLPSAASNCPEDLSLKSHHNLPVSYSSWPCSSERVLPTVSSDPTSSCIFTTVSTFVSSTSVTTSSSTISRSMSPSSHMLEDIQGRPSIVTKFPSSDDVRVGPSTVTKLPPSTSSSDVRTKSDVIEKRTENVITLTSSCVIPSVPLISSVQDCTSPSGSDNSVITRSASGTASCPKRASDRPVGPLVLDTEPRTVPTTASRYQKYLSVTHNIKADCCLHFNSCFSRQT